MTWKETETLRVHPHPNNEHQGELVRFHGQLPGRDGERVHLHLRRFRDGRSRSMESRHSRFHGELSDSMLPIKVVIGIAVALLTLYALCFSLGGFGMFGEGKDPTFQYVPPGMH